MPPLKTLLAAIVVFDSCMIMRMITSRLARFFYTPSYYSIGQQPVTHV